MNSETKAQIYVVVAVTLIIGLIGLGATKCDSRKLENPLTPPSGSKELLSPPSGPTPSPEPTEVPTQYVVTLYSETGQMLKRWRTINEGIYEIRDLPYGICFNDENRKFVVVSGTFTVEEQ